MQHKRVVLMVLTIAALCSTVSAVLRAGSAERSIGPQSTDTALVRETSSSSSEAGILGLVRQAHFVRLDPEDSAHTGPARLTAIQPWTAMSPEAAEVSLAAHEGKAIMVTGMDQGDWIYSAEIVEVAGPILSAVTRRVFGAAGPPGAGAAPDSTGEGCDGTE